MPSTEDFEHLLDCENVRAVEWDGSKVVVRVSTKVDESTLNLQDNLEIQVGPYEIDVIDEGGDRGDGHYILENRQAKHRPVPAGVSEGHENITAGTGSIYPVTVDDTSRGIWDSAIAEGETVRLSNNHVYANVNKAEVGDDILQPGPADQEGDKVGELAGYVPIENGVTVDVAARTTSEDSDTVLGIPNVPSGIIRDGFDDLRYRQMKKSGRTTAVTTGTIQQTSASVNVRVGDDTIKFRDMLITTNMSKPGDTDEGFINESR